MKFNIALFLNLVSACWILIGCGGTAGTSAVGEVEASKLFAETSIVSGSILVSTIVSTTSGTFQGALPDGNGITSFKGIPYAAPPTGQLRWRPPQPAKLASGVRQALQFGNDCISSPGPLQNSPNQSEDCLTLNVWTPRLSGSAPKPVMVWLHGGGFQFGTSATPTYDGSLLAAQDVVVVSLNYRLGVFGFLATQQFDDESGSSGAWGLLDQVAALQWVQQNIKQFGGDPRKVTLFGESAGAHSVGMLMASSRSRGIFSKAIIQSGATWDTEHGSIATHQEAIARGKEFSSKFLNQDLRQVPADLIRAAAPWDQLTDPTITAFGPSIDGDLLTDSPINIFLKKKQLDIPVMGGWNGAEWFPFVARALPAAPAEVFYTAAAKLFGQNCVQRFKSLYPPTDDTNAQQSSFQLDGDLGIAEQTWEALTLQAQINNAYAYRFIYTSPYAPVAIHTSEVPFVFGTLTRQVLAPAATPSTEDRRISKTMMSYWTNFARSGNPNGAGLPYWPELGTNGMNVLRLDSAPAAESNPDVERFRFIANYRNEGRLPEAWRSLASPYIIQYQGSACP